MMDEILSASGANYENSCSLTKTEFSVERIRYEQAA
jgi:hypothetical protein